MKDSKLDEYIKDMGPDLLSLQLEIDISTIYNWKNRRCIPEPKIAKKLIDNARGHLSWDDIYTPFFKKD